MDVKLVKKAYEEARNAFRELQGDSADADFAGNGADDADAILARLEAQEKKGKMNENEEEEWGGIGGNEEDESQDQDEEDPSSFSGIPTSVLHSHLNLPTTTTPPSSKLSISSFLSSLKSAGPPSSPSDIHMAFNYWFHPPNDRDRFTLPYKDSLVWKYLRDEQRAAYGAKKGLKRKAEEKDAPAMSTKPISKKKRLKL
ncbi:hypothetical protein FRC04_003513 [Tulasnella sp. 424]|nr:hypothetical protein FRC04_003513 [Tulasnella sp. 424]KAG8962870.1 hypothetical protein FRC05_005078 [Tulasnella sp. 425]